MWTILQGDGGQVTSPDDPNSIFLGQVNEHYILEWQISTLCDTAWDEVNIAFGFVPYIFQCGDTVFDVRDGQNYPTILIGQQCWMARNMNIGVKIPGSILQNNNDEIEKYCYENLDSNCNIYGGLFQWNEMMQYTNIEGTQGICPDGWHIPTDIEWCTLEQEVDTSITCNVTNWRGINGGGKLKETDTIHWNAPNVGATNSSGFTALPSGNYYPDGTFNWIGVNGNIWTSTEGDTSNALMRGVANFISEIYRGEFNKSRGFAVRCIKSDFYQPNQPPIIPT
nr:hypothetical protein [Bacteroidota bacterium]